MAGEDRLMTRLKTPRRGHIAYGIVILIFILATMCGLVLDTSLEMIREQVVAERRAREQAAFEAAAAILASDPMAESLLIEGRTFEVRCAEPEVDGDSLKRELAVTLHDAKGELLQERGCTILYHRIQSKQWEFRGFAP